MILMIHMIDTDNIVGHTFGANFGYQYDAGTVCRAYNDMDCFGW